MHKRTNYLTPDPFLCVKRYSDAVTVNANPTIYVYATRTVLVLNIQYSTRSLSHSPLLSFSFCFLPVFYCICHTLYSSDLPRYLFPFSASFSLYLSVSRSNCLFLRSLFPFLSSLSLSRLSLPVFPRVYHTISQTSLYLSHCLYLRSLFPSLRFPSCLSLSCRPACSPVALC